MFISPAEALVVLEHYKYFLIFPIAIIEGPIISIITGFLVFLGYLNAYVAYFVLVGADMIGDSLYYLIGKYWRKWTWAKKYARFVGYSEKSEMFLESHFQRHTAKTLLIAKVSHGVGAAVQISSGIAGLEYRKFLWYSFIGTIFKSFVLLVIGFYLGRSYLKINEYIHSFALVTLSIAAILLITYVVVNRYAKSYLTKKTEGVDIQEK